MAGERIHATRTLQVRNRATATVVFKRIIIQWFVDVDDR